MHSELDLCRSGGTFKNLKQSAAWWDDDDDDIDDIDEDC